MSKEDKNKKEERRKESEARNASRGRTGRDSKGEDDHYFIKWQDASPNQPQEKQTHMQSETRI
jgi:hypothetical protein